MRSVIVATALLAACGSDQSASDTSATSEPVATSTTTTLPAATTTVPVATSTTTTLPAVTTTQPAQLEQPAIWPAARHRVRNP